MRFLFPTQLRCLLRRGFVLRAALVLLLGFASATTAGAFDARGAQFLGFTNFSLWKKSSGTNRTEVVLRSPEITACLDWNELVASWNIALPADGFLCVEARAIQPDAATKFYVLGCWSADPQRHPRASVPGQRDADGDVATDTLKLLRPCRKFQIGLILGGGTRLTDLKFLGMSLLDNRVRPAPLAPNRAAWGRTIAVPERSQMPFPNGGTLCSPAVVSMLLGHWAGARQRPDWDRTVPEVAAGVDDPNWPGTGNWALNMACAGALPGLRAYVARLSDVSELEDWIARGVPVGLSLCYNRLRGQGGEPSGHLVVCVGFTEAGDVIVNDPGTSRNVRKTFPRANLTAAWAYSRRTVYLVYPADRAVPEDRFGHWDSSVSRRRMGPGN